MNRVGLGPPASAAETPTLHALGDCGEKPHLRLAIGRLHLRRHRIDNVAALLFPVLSMIRVRAFSALVVALSILLSSISFDAAAQGFPGGGGGGGGMRGGHGGMKPSGGSPTRPPADQPTSSPMAVFFERLRGMRMELLVRDDQVDRWTAMQDALRAYVDLERDTSGQRGATVAMDPLQHVRNLADTMRSQGDALQKVSDSIGSLMTILDDRQRNVFATRLADALAAAPTPAR